MLQELASLYGAIHKLRLQEEGGRYSKNVNLCQRLQGRMSTKEDRWSKKAKNLST